MLTDQGYDCADADEQSCRDSRCFLTRRLVLAGCAVDEHEPAQRREHRPLTAPLWLPEHGRRLPIGVLRVAAYLAATLVRDEISALCFRDARLRHRKEGRLLKLMYYRVIHGLPGTDSASSGV